MSFPTKTPTTKAMVTNASHAKTCPSLMGSGVGHYGSARKGGLVSVAVVSVQSGAP